MNNKEEQLLLANLSRNTKTIMERQKISLKQLAEKSGLTIHVIRNIKDANVKRLNSANIFKLAFGLGVSPKELLGVDKLPKSVRIKEEYLEFITSFYEREGEEFEEKEKCVLYKQYDEEYEPCVVKCIHSFVQAHKLATGYYYEGMDGTVIRGLTKEYIEKGREEHWFEQWLNEDSKKDAETRLVSKNEIDEAKATGESIQMMRELYQVTRKELAKRTGLSEDCLFRIETGKNKKINYKHISLIARELFCTVDFLLGKSCDPTATQEGHAKFYSRDEFIYRYVQIGHDLAYAKNYMDKESKDVLIGIIRSLDSLYDYREYNEVLKSRRLSLQNVFFREQKRYMEAYKTRGAHFYTQKYTLENKGEEFFNE